MFFAKDKENCIAKANRDAMATSRVGGSVLVFIFSKFNNGLQRD